MAEWDSGGGWVDPATSDWNLLQMLGPDRLAALGYNGPLFDQSVASGSPEQGGTPYGTQISPELAQWMAQNGYSLAADFPGGSTITANLLNSSGSPVSSYSYDDGGGLFDYLPALGSLAVLGVGAAGGLGAGASPASSLTGPGALDAYGAMDAGYGAAGAGGAGAAEAAGGSAAGLASSAPAYGGVGTAGAGAGTDAVLGGYGGTGGLAAASKGAGMADLGWGDWAKIGAQLGSTFLQSNAASNAADAQAASTAAALAEQRRQYDTTRADFEPWRTAGAGALKQLSTDINRPTTAADVMQDPGYQFGLDQGQQAIDRKIAAAGGRVSGAAIKAAGRFGTNYATTGYGAADQRRNDRLNRLAALAGIGQTATAGTAQAGMNSANNSSGLLTNQGANQGAAALAQGNIWGNGANAIAALYGRPYSPGGP